MLALLIAISFCGTMVYAAVSDLLTMKISNLACLFLAASFVFLAPASGLSLYDTGFHLVAAFVTLVICFGLFSLNAMGGGDAKLISATVLWTGFSSSLASYLLVSAIAGGILTLCILALRQLINRPRIKHLGFLYRLTDPAQGIPYGIALAIAALWIFPQLPIFH